jgi:MOSC domain-containing protein YiiM
VHRTAADLADAVERLTSAPTIAGVVELIVCRPELGERRVLDVAHLSTEHGLVGDTWRVRPSRHTADGGPDPAKQVTLMSARAAALFAGDRDRWPLAGDQLYVDLDISIENLPPGSRLSVGDAVLEVSAEPHTGCAKFVERFGPDVWSFVQSPDGRRLRARGVNTRVVTAGTVRTAQAITRIEPSAG